MNFRHLVAGVATVIVLALAPSAQAGGDVNTNGLRKAVTAENVFGHQADLETIANANGMTRHTLTPGYQGSVDYIVGQLKSFGYSPEVVPFNMPEWVENSTPTFSRTDVDPEESYVAGTADDDDSPDVDFISFEHSPPAASTDAAVVPTSDIQIRAPAEAPAAANRRTSRRRPRARSR